MNSMYEAYVAQFEQARRDVEAMPPQMREALVLATLTFPALPSERATDGQAHSAADGRAAVPD